LQFYETGETPRKNIDVMQEAIAEASAKQPTTGDTSKKKKKKAKKDVDEVYNYNVLIKCIERCISAIQYHNVLKNTFL
jgi:hypothetical protein